MIPFTKPGASEAYPADGRRPPRAWRWPMPASTTRWIEQAYVGYVFGDSTAGQAAVYGVGLTGIPVINVNNNCSTGSTALFLARQAVQSGAVECALALGFEQMVPGPLKGAWTDRPSPLAHFIERMAEDQGYDEAAAARRAVLRRRRRATTSGQHGIDKRTFARISVKARQHAARNPLAVFRQTVTLDEVLAAPGVRPADAAAVLPADLRRRRGGGLQRRVRRRHGLDRRVRIAAQAMTTDGPSTFDSHDMRKPGGLRHGGGSGQQGLPEAGIGPDDVDVVELHDCFTANELITYEALGLTPEGTAEKFIVDGDNTYGGRVVTNPSGGLLSKGHPLGATGLAQCAELTWQLRGQADQRQVEGARVALQHNLGLGGACVVTCTRGGMNTMRLRRHDLEHMIDRASSA
jgi:acetyl-CoA acetyltransferase